MIKNTCIFISVILYTCCIFSQSNTASSYSIYGIGELKESVSIRQRSMGRLKNLQINGNNALHNPSLSAGISETNLQMGVIGATVNIKSNTDSYRKNYSNFTYLAVGIPISNKIALNFGLMPFSAVNYETQIQTFESDGITLKEITTFSGEGGSSKVFLSGGFELVEGLKIGFQGNYLFGNIEHLQTTQPEDANELLSRYQHTNSLNGFSINTGVHYTKKLKNDLMVQTGFTVTNQTKLNGSIKQYLYSISSSQVAKDTTLNQRTRGDITIPSTFSAGIGFGKQDRWFVGADITSREKLTIDNAFYQANTNEVYSDYSKFSLGGFYKFKQKGLMSYWKKITYRAGTSFTNTGLSVDADSDGFNFEEIKDYAFTFGFGFPIGKKYSNLDLGFELGQRGTDSSGALKENYFNTMVGISLGDQWFKKREIF